MNMFWVWLAVLIVTAIVEFISVELISIWCSFGAIVALIANACGASVELQIIIFFVVSLTLLLSLRKIAKKWLLRNTKDAITNTDLNLNKTFKLSTEIGEDNGVGTIKINGVEWSCVSNDGQPIPAGTKVVTLEVKGNKYVVKAVEEETEETKENKE